MSEQQRTIVVCGSWFLVATGKHVEWHRLMTMDEARQMEGRFAAEAGITASVPAANGVRGEGVPAEMPDYAGNRIEVELPNWRGEKPNAVVVAGDAFGRALADHKVIRLY